MKNTLLTVFTMLVMLFSVQAESANKKQIEVEVPQGKFIITPLSQRAVRFQLTNSMSKLLPEYVYLERKKNIKHTLSKRNKNFIIKLDEMSVLVNQNDGRLTIKDKEGKVIFLQNEMGLSKNTIHGSMTQKATLSFHSDENEHLYGLGEFQDGYLNVRGLSRRLTQVNTQISVPIIISDKGYGIQWNNYGLTDFNPCSKSVSLVRQEVASKKDIVDQTTSEGNKRTEILSNVFEAEVNIEKDGQYALLLDMGQKMSHSHNLIIDNNTVIEMKNIWLPPTASTICYLTKGKHKLSSISDKNDSPTLYYRMVDDETTFSSPVAGAVDFTVYAGCPNEVIASYREVTGQAPLMPLWALGYIHCRERFHSQNEILNTADRFRKEGYPIDMIVQDWQYWGNNGWNAMKFDSEAYPDPKAMVDKLHSNNIRFMLSVWSKIDGNSEVGKEMDKKGYFIPNTTWVDFFNPKAAEEYWTKFSNKLLKPYGIDAWWQDATEPENDDLENRLIANKSTIGEKYRNIYSLLVNKTVYDGSIKDVPEKRAMILTRCGFSGIQRYGAAVWSGDVGNDFETLRRQITAGLGLVSTGLPWWTLDAGGFFRPRNQYTDKAYHERFVRWLQVSTFLPLMRVHGYMSDTEFWNYGPEVEKIAHKYLDLRYRMLPYIYNQTKEISNSGSNILRPLIMDFTNDKKALDQKYEYMFGPSILVAPVVKENVKEWPVYLPENETGWVDFWNGNEYKGGTDIIRKVKLEDIPVFVKKGSIIVLADTLLSTTQLNSSPLEIRVYPGADASTEVYNDNGIDFGYKNGKSATIKIDWDDNKHELIIGKRKGKFDGMPKSVAIRVIIVKGAKESNYIEKTLEYKGKRSIIEFN